MNCGHTPMSAFKAGGLWKCSGCGVEARWGESWSYHGALGCHKCGQEPVIDFVACSEACAAKHQSDASDLRKRRKVEQLKREIGTLDEQVVNARDRRARLVRELAKSADAVDPVKRGTSV